MAVLVTGALGNVGRFVIDHLQKMNIKCIAADIDLDRLNKTYNAYKSVDTVYFDITDPKTFDNALRHSDRVFLMRPPQIGDPKALLPFIEAMTKSDIQLVAFLSLMGVEKNPIPPHHKIEKYIEKHKLPFVHIRPGFFMQNIAGIHAEEIKENNEIYIPAGKSKTSFIDASDIGLAIATVLSKPNKYKNTTHTITGPESLNYTQVAQILSDVLKRDIRYKKPSFLAYRKHYIKVRNLNKKYVNVTMMLYLMTRLGTAKKVTDTFQTLTGKKPRTFKDFASDNKDTWIK
ncbi:MAG: NmrA family NAD(P)-binding protein [Bacillota bacterium]